MTNADEREEQVVSGVDRLRRGPEAPSGLEQRVVEALRGQRLIRRSSPWSRSLVLAASIALFAAGALAGRLVWSPVSVPAASGARYLLLLTGTTEPAADPDARAAEYAAWATGLAQRGVEVTGEELSEQADHVGVAPDADLATLASVAGYFVLTADNDLAAADLARGCPHVRYGGAVVVRRIQSR